MSAYYRQYDTYLDISTPSAPVMWVCTTAGDKTSSVWAKLSGGCGGGGSVTQYRIISDGGDFWMCKTWDGTTLGSTIVPVIKPWKLRSGAGAIASEIIDGITFTYAYTPVTVGAVIGYYTRTVTGSDGSYELNYPDPPPLVNDLIDVMPCTVTNPVSVATATLVNSGTGGTYAVNDILTLNSGTGTKATIRVDTVSAGLIATFTLLTQGDYTAAPALTGVGVTGGGGTGATFNLTLNATLKDLNTDARAWSEI